MKIFTWKVTETNCWICTSHKADKYGYVQLIINNLRTSAHRYVFSLYNGEIPKGMIIRHKCDMTLCINPDHLELGTHQDNVRDRVERGRSASGVNNGRSKLSEQNVRDIRMSNDSFLNLSKIYGVDQKTIKSVKNYETWKHVL